MSISWEKQRVCTRKGIERDIKRLRESLDKLNALTDGDDIRKALCEHEYMCDHFDTSGTKVSICRKCGEEE